MKKTQIRPFFVALLFLMMSISLTAQVYKFRSTELSFRYEKENGQWTNWDEPTESSVLITMDIDNQRITIYSKEKQVYDFAEYEGIKTDEDGDDIMSFYCVDNNGKTCRVSYMLLHSRNERKQFYVYYNDYNFVYNVNVLD